jgi:1-deoxy-D-xylulose-5-phosphate synthase
MKKIEIGRAHCLKHGTETAVLSNGPRQNVTLALANLNNPTTIAHDFAFVKPLDERITFCFKTFKTIITIEDGVTKGGFGSAILSLPPKQLYRKIQLLGIPDEFIEHGTVDELQEYCKIDVKSLEIVFLLSQNNYFALLNTMRL